MTKSGIWFLPPPYSGMIYSPIEKPFILPWQEWHIHSIHQLKIRLQNLLEGVKSTHLFAILYIATKPVLLWCMEG